MISVMGFGKCGNTAVSMLPEHPNFDKIYIGADAEDFQETPDVGRVELDYHYELSAWDPVYEVKQYLRRYDTEAMLKEYMEKVSMIIVVTALGVPISLAAKEFLKFFISKEKPVHVVCSEPFHHESDFLNTSLCNELICFLRENDKKLGWSLLENEKLLTRNGVEYHGSVDKTLEKSCMLLADMVKTMLGMVGEDEEENLLCTKIQEDDLVKLLYHHLVYVSYVELKRNEKLLISKMYNNYLPYLPDRGSDGLLMMEIPTGVDSIVEISEMMDRILEFFGGGNNFTCRLISAKNGTCKSTDGIETNDKDKEKKSKNDDEPVYRYWFLCKGMESADKRIPLYEVTYF